MATENGEAIIARNASKMFLDGAVVAFRALDLVVREKEILCIVGPSGCGKTTFLRCIAGLTEINTGQLLVHGKPVAGPPDGVAMVFQHFGLLPWKTVYDNAAFGLAMAGAPAAVIKERVTHYLDLVGLSGFEKHYPYQLSGGMQQRVGLARALASDPEVMLMDEPLGALDALTREQIQELILKLWWETKKMFFFITHSVEEALFLATELIVMTPSPGRIAHRYRLEFGRRFVESRDARAVKADPEFIRLREEVLGLIHSAPNTAEALVP